MKTETNTRFFPAILPRKGSAFIMTVGLVSVMIIIVIGFFRTTVSRRYSTRFMSNEKRAEALAESAIDLAYGFFRDKINDPNETNIYGFFRLSAPLQGTSMGVTGGENNIPLDITSLPTLEFDANSPALLPIQTLIDEVGGPENVPVLRVQASFATAEAFSSRVEGYQVAGVSIRHHDSDGSASFLNRIANPARSDGSLADWIGEIPLTFFLPNRQQTDQHPVDIYGAGIFVSARVEVSKIADMIAEALIRVIIPLVPRPITRTFGPKRIDFEETFRRYIDIGNRPLSLQSIFEVAMPGVNKNSISISAAVLKAAISARASGISGCSFSPPNLIEKGGRLRFRAVVEYLPTGPGGAVINRVLVAEREYKVSDIQPPAPEYAFFVANSNLLNEEPMSSLSGLGNRVVMSEAGAMGASMTIHTLPGKSYNNCTGFSGGDTSATSLAQVPGLVRINSNQRMQINTFLGTKDEPHLTEYNALAGNRRQAQQYSTTSIFQWENPQHIIDFPVVRHWPSGAGPFRIWPNTPPGIRNLKNILNFADALDSPILLMGYGQFGYPLGMRVEANLDKLRGDIRVGVDPRGTMGGDDRTRVYIEYRNLPSPYGIAGKPAYDSPGQWRSDSYEFMPANLYSTLQYAKKANFFYPSEADFWGDTNLVNGNNLKIKGVVYVGGNLTIDRPLNVTGRGLLVVRRNIIIRRNITRGDDRTVFGLLARDGAVTIQSGCNRIEASVFSNHALTNSSGNSVEINGNLVVNEFRRGVVGSLSVVFNSAACRISPLSVVRDAGKFDPDRYFVSLGPKWALFEYEKR